jgi:hypothetical protein
LGKRPLVSFVPGRPFTPCFGEGLLAPGDRDLVEFSGAELLGKLKPVHDTHPGTLLPE